MKTKKQKIDTLEELTGVLAKSKTLAIADFTGLPTKDLNSFRQDVRDEKAAFQVVKKRLLRILLNKAGYEFDSKDFKGQFGVVFSPSDLLATAALVYKFAKSKNKKDKNLFRILGGFDFSEKRFVDGVEMVRLGGLPSREVMLGQLVGLLASPLRTLLYVLDQRKQKVG